jgi:DNA-directed RNA polymerase specialized sigma24 family protein
VLRLALPHFLPGVLDPDEDAKSREEDLDHAAVLSAALRLSEMLDGPQRLVLGMKIAGASDAEIAPVLGVSRRTVTNRKAAAYKALEAVVGPLNEVERLAVLDHLGDVIQNELIQN